MKPLLYCTAALALAASVGAFALRGNAQPKLDTALAPCVSSRVDEPPPEPIDCPFCSGDGALHRVRMIALERKAVRALLLVLPR